MHNFLKLFYLFALAVMTAGTVAASLDRDILIAIDELWSDPWFRVTIFDTYFAFLTVYLWVAYKERSWLARAVWLLLFLGLGTFAYAVYILRELFRLQPGDGFETLLTRRYGGSGAGSSSADASSASS
ncbi:MAG: DUF1475 family protein [Acidobacteriota bacterium]|nr:DUF1475 family protein [Acidobacteriota bacterium]